MKKEKTIKKSKKNVFLLKVEVNQVLMNENNSIKNWAEDDKPREKLIKKGVSSLSNSELIAILIGSGNQKQSAVELSKYILGKHNNSFYKLAQKSTKELCLYNGIGPAKAVSIIAAFEIARRKNLENVDNKIEKITSSNRAYSVLKPFLQNLNHEEFWVIYLSQSNIVISVENISKGGITSTSVDFRVLLKKAILNNSTGIIIAHNHPSGNPKPSTSDIELTKKLKVASLLLDIKLLDHLILFNNSYLSFQDEGINF